MWDDGGCTLRRPGTDTTFFTMVSYHTTHAGCKHSASNSTRAYRSHSFQEKSDSSELTGAEIQRRQDIANALVDESHPGAEIDWDDDTQGYLSNCPGEAHHTSKEGYRDCRINIDGTPTLFCFHQHCVDAVEDFNRALRGRILDDGGCAPSNRVASVSGGSKWPNICTIIQKRTAASLPVIIERNPWPVQRILECSSVPVAEMAPKDQWKALVALFPDTDEPIWIGQKPDSGREEFRDRFRTRAKWLSYDAEAPANYILPALLKPNSFSRTKEDIVRKPFCVVESDELDHAGIGAVFKWLMTTLGWKLQAIVDAAGKSLHGWFETPDLPPKELSALITGLKCDASVLRETQPVRLPGAMRGARLQKLIYLSRNLL